MPSSRVRGLVSVGLCLLLGGAAGSASGAGTAPAAAQRTTGPLTVTERGAVVEDVVVEGGISIEADDVLVRRTRVVNGGIHSIRVAAGVVGTRIEDTEVVCTNPRGNGLVFGGYTAVRVSVSGCRNAFLSTSGGRTVVRDSTQDGAPVGGVGAGGGAEPGDDVTAAAGAPPPLPPPPRRPARRGTGHRSPLVETITAQEAVRRLRRDPLLERVRIVGRLRLSGRDGHGWTIRDSQIDSGAPYLVEAFTGDEPFSGPLSSRPRFEHVTLVGAGAADPEGAGTSACFYGSDAVLAHVHAYGCIDVLKPYDRVLVEDSHAHALHKPDGAHADVVQVRGGSDTVLRRNLLDAGVAYSPSAGSEGNAVLQTGSLTGPVVRLSLTDNEVVGGLYTLRLGDRRGPGGEEVDVVLRRNRHGARFRYGPVTGDAGAPTSRGGVRYDASNVWASSGAPVLSSPEGP